MSRAPGVSRTDFEFHALSMLEEEALDEFMERYDLEPIDVVMLLYDAGYLDLEYESDELDDD
jgi:hypothetical protein